MAHFSEMQMQLISESNRSNRKYHQTLKETPKESRQHTNTWGTIKTNTVQAQDTAKFHSSIKKKGVPIFPPQQQYHPDSASTFYLFSEFLPRRPNALLDRDDGAVKEEALVHQPEAAQANQVGLTEALGRLSQLVQRELPRSLVLRRRRAPASLAPLHCHHAHWHHTSASKWMEDTKGAKN